MYMIRSKAHLLCMRDRATGEMKDVGPRRWVPFEALPAGFPPEGDGDVSVKLIECPEDLAAIEAENKRLEAADELVEKKREELRKAKAAEMDRVLAEREKNRKTTRIDLSPADMAKLDAAEEARQKRLALKKAARDDLLARQAEARKRSAEILAAEAEKKAKEKADLLASVEAKEAPAESPKPRYLPEEPTPAEAVAPVAPPPEEPRPEAKKDSKKDKKGGKKG
jgi:hypothetical protein